jgi:hypothetical protein
LRAAAASSWAKAVPIQAETRCNADRLIALANSKADLVILDDRHEDVLRCYYAGAKRLLDMDADSLAKIVASPSTPLLFHCKGSKCGPAAKATENAVSLGYSDIYFYAWE